MPAHADQHVGSRLPHRHGKQRSMACKLPPEVAHAARTSAHLLACASFSHAVRFPSLFHTASHSLVSDLVVPKFKPVSY